MTEKGSVHSLKEILGGASPMLGKNICLYLLIGAILCLNQAQAAPDDAQNTLPALHSLAAQLTRTAQGTLSAQYNRTLQDTLTERENTLGTKLKDAASLVGTGGILNGIINPILSVPEKALGGVGSLLG